MAPSAYPATAPPYSSAIILAFFSLLLALLITPAATWHIRNRNIGASSLVIIALIRVLMTFINATIWPADNIPSWFSGRGLCDIEVKLQVASHVLIPGACACMLRALARVMDTERTTLGLSTSQKRRDLALELGLCLALPLLQMLAHYIVQPSRYSVYGIAGCVPTVDSSWPTVVFILLPPVLLTLVDTYYATLIILRLRRYRRAFTSIMANSNMTKSRFLRLFLICLAIIFASVPAQVYVFYTVVQWEWMPYSWDKVHSAGAWDVLEMVPSEGRIFYDRYIWLGEGMVMFLLFGVGKDAFRMYKSGLVKIGLGKVFPSLRPEYQGSTTRGSGVLASVGSKAKGLLKKKNVVSTWFSSKGSQASTSSTDFSVDDSPKKLIFIDASGDESLKKQKPRPSRLDLEANTQRPTRTSGWTRFFRSASGDNSHGGRKDSETMALSSIMTNQTTTVSSEVKGGEVSPICMLGRSKDEVYVKREIRQGSESAESTKPIKMYEGV